MTVRFDPPEAGDDTRGWLPGLDVPSQGIAFHPIANLFPLIEGAEFDELVADVKANGIREEIVILGNEILDGRNRYRAGVAAGIFPADVNPRADWHFVFFGEAGLAGVNEGDDPLAYVLSKNLHRRHLTDDQRRMVAARLANLGRGRPTTENPPTRRNYSAAEAAEQLHVNLRGTERAKEVIAHGAPELQAAVDAGVLTVRKAAEIAKQPEAKQLEELNRRGLRGVLPGGARSIMASRQEPDDSLDFFPTPPWATRGLLEHALRQTGRRADLHKQSAWDPACGEGHVTGVLESYFAEVIGTDIFDYSVAGRSPPGWRYCRDFLDRQEDLERPIPAADWIITNPPFGAAAIPFVLTALDLARVGVAMFFRLGILESVDRYNTLFGDRPPTLCAFWVERVNLCKGRWDPDGSTATAYVWLVWVKGAAPRPPFWIPPGQRQALTLPGDRERFTAHPVKAIPDQQEAST